MSNDIAVVSDSHTTVVLTAYAGPNGTRMVQLSVSADAGTDWCAMPLALWDQIVTGYQAFPRLSPPNNSSG